MAPFDRDPDEHDEIFKIAARFIIGCLILYLGAHVFWALISK